jgi:hypothetical protein
MNGKRLVILTISAIAQAIPSLVLLFHRLWRKGTKWECLSPSLCPRH